MPSLSSNTNTNTNTNTNSISSDHHTLSFLEKLEARIVLTNSLLCVGLDPHENELYTTANAKTSTTTTTTNTTAVVPRTTTEETCDAIYTFCKNLIDATLEYTCCYKPNIAFFECVGRHGEGIAVLHRICMELIVPHNIPILLDVKRGDIGTTAAAYAQACFETLPADAITVSPLMGYDSIVPFLVDPYTNKGIFVLCKTSNPGSQDFLNLTIASSSTSSTNTEETLYERIASLTSNTWHPQHPSTTFGLVVGATDTTALQKVRTIIQDDVWILAPGIGAQGGNLPDTCTYGMNARGSGIIIPISRGISTATNPKLAAQTFHQQIQTIRNQRIAEYQNNSNNRSTCHSTDAAGTTADSAASSQSIPTPPPLPPQPITTTTNDQLQDYQKEFIQFSIQQQVLQFGTYTLKSGRRSPYFFNAGLFHTGYALYQLGCAYATTIMKSSALAVVSSSSSSSLQSRTDGDVNFDVIFGPAYKGIPLGAIVSSALYAQYGVNVEFTYNRKEVKDHGEGGQLVGASMTNKRVLIIDDVITAGTAIRESYDLLTSVNAIPMGVVIALDRAEIRSRDDPQSAVQAVERDLSIPVVSIITLVELQRFLEEQPSDVYDVTTLQSVIDYRKEYGAL